MIEGYLTGYLALICQNFSFHNIPELRPVGRGGREGSRVGGGENRMVVI